MTRSYARSGLPRSRDEKRAESADTRDVTRLLRLLMVLGVLAAIVVADAAAYKVDSTPPPAGAVGTPYSFTFKAVGGSAPHTFTVDSGVIPPGLALAGEGELAGTPTASGTFNFYIKATDSTGLRSEVKFSITIDSKLTITTNSLPAATRGVPYSVTLGLSGGTATSWTVSAGTLPPGFTLSNSGVLAGTASTEGSTTFTVKASNGSKSDTKQLTLTVVAPLGISIGAIPPAIVGQPFATQLAATGGVGTYSFTLTGGTLPSGLTFDTASGVIAGRRGAQATTRCRSPLPPRVVAQQFKRSGSSSARGSASQRRTSPSLASDAITRPRSWSRAASSRSRSPRRASSPGVSS